jgi:DNA-binding NarL/FixJ family response regulator
MIRLLIADDHAIVRSGLRQIISETDNIRVAGEASSGREALEKVDKEEFDVVLLDISLPDRSGLEVLKQLKSEQPHLSVLILTMHPEEQFAVRALKAGASGYVTKESAPDELIEAILRVSKGGKYITASLAERLASVLDSTTEQPPHEVLSDRELEVMRMVASGDAVKDIADKLYLSVKTVSTYRTRILEKMNFKNTAEIIRYALKHNLVD